MLEGLGKRVCSRPLWQHSPVPVSASESAVVCPAAEPSHVASFGAAPHLPHPCPGCCQHCRLPGREGTEVLGSASLSKAPYLSENPLKVSWEPETWLGGSSLSKWVEAAALHLGPGVKGFLWE